MSEVILNRLVKNIVKATEINLWKSTREILEWFRSFPDKQNGCFIGFDIVEFYPSITEKLLLKAIDLAKQFNTIHDLGERYHHPRKTHSSIQRKRALEEER